MKINDQRGCKNITYFHDLRPGQVFQPPDNDILMVLDTSYTNGKNVVDLKNGFTYTISDVTQCEILNAEVVIKDDRKD